MYCGANVSVECQAFPLGGGGGGGGAVVVSPCLVGGCGVVCSGLECLLGGGGGDAVVSSQECTYYILLMIVCTDRPYQQSLFAQGAISVHKDYFMHIGTTCIYCSCIAHARESK